MTIDAVTQHISITNIYGVQRNNTSHFDTIITICQDSVEDNVSGQHYHHFELADGEPPGDAFNPGECSYDLFTDAVCAITNHVEQDQNVLVHCHAGRSRSAMAIVAALTDLKNMTYDMAFTTVSNARTGGISPSNELQVFAQQYSSTP